jgi:hypothetical protein
VTTCCHHLSHASVCIVSQRNGRPRLTHLPDQSRQHTGDECDPQYPLRSSLDRAQNETKVYASGLLNILNARTTGQIHTHLTAMHAARTMHNTIDSRTIASTGSGLMEEALAGLGTDNETNRAPALAKITAFEARWEHPVAKAATTHGRTALLERGVDAQTAVDAIESVTGADVSSRSIRTCLSRMSRSSCASCTRASSRRPRPARY